MEHPVNVTCYISLEYEVGSPPDGEIDFYQVANPLIMELESTWMVRDNENSGLVTSATTALYPPFEDANRRTIFGIYKTQGSITNTLTWNGQTMYLGRIWINTDPNWSTSITVSTLSEGSWFAIEGELESDHRIWRRGRSVDATL